MQSDRPTKEALIVQHPELADYKSVTELLLDAQPWSKDAMDIKKEFAIKDAKIFFKQTAQIPQEVVEAFARTDMVKDNQHQEKPSHVERYNRSRSPTSKSEHFR